MSKSPARRRLLTACVVAVAGSTTLAAAASPAAAHRSIADTKRVSEKKLRALEARTIGPVHAAEHAAQRADLRSPRARARRARAERAARANSLRADASALTDAAEIGSWGDPTPLPSVAIHSAVLSTGKVLFFGSANRAVTLWDPKTGTSKTLASPKAADGTEANLFCAGQSFLADGRLLVTGGQLEGAAGPGTTYKGLNTVFTFDPLTEEWTRHPNMRDGRWYPTQVLLPDGRTAIMDGLDDSGVEGRDANNDIEIFTPAAKRDEPGTISFLGRRGADGQPPKGALYPHMFLMPSGRTLVAGPQDVDSWFLESLGSGLAFNWTPADDPQNHFFGTGVILPKSTPGSTEVALIGGDRSRQVETFDETKTQVGWTEGSPLQQARGHHNTVLLPDGSMVTVGGGIGLSEGSLSKFETGHLDAELWNPVTKDWKRAAAQQEGRAYHSTALLLPDGRVMSAGDDTNGQGGNATDTAEVYSPPYLFNASGGAAVRPAVASAPGRTDYGQSFAVGFAGSDVERAVLIAPGAVTHANDMSQRYVPLALSDNGAGSATLTAPANANHAPPGRYMLFLINAAGVPSEARFIQVGGPPAETSAPPSEPTPTPTGTSTPGDTGSTPGDTGTTTGTPPATGTTPIPVNSLGLSVGKRQTVGTVRARGLRSTTRCSGACTVRAELRLDRRAAVKLMLVSRSSGSTSVVIGRGSVTLQKATDGRLVVALTRSAKRQLRRTRSISVRLTLVATHSGGKRQTLTRRLTLRR